jgi:phenylpyruvate tautomerase PptA (4-oxalocrotonate tautomerase family)
MEEQMELFEDGGLRDEGGMVDEESGNDVPSGSTKKEVRDDIPAMLSEGEFVLPADVVRYHGLEKIMQLRDEAKFGLKKMEAMGQMGNSEEATLDDDVPFGPADLLIVAGGPEDEPREMAEGGVVHAQAGTFVQPATGIMGYQPSIYQGQQTSTTYTPPPSSVAPPTPTPSPAGGYVPKFVTEGATPFDDGSLAPKPVATPSTSDTSAVSTASTEDKFVPEVQDKYTTLKYINKETGEIRDFYFYNGSPVTPIPDGFIPYDESVDEVVDDLESTTVETTQVRERDDDPFKDLPKPEAVDYTTFTKDELMKAFEDNNNARLALTAMGVVNPMIALFGRFATGQQQKNILAEMEARGIKTPETKGNIIDRISDMISGLFGTDKDEVKKVIEKGDDDDFTPITSSGPSKRGRPTRSLDTGLTDDDMGLPSGPAPIGTLPSSTYDAIPSPEEIVMSQPVYSGALGPEDFAPYPTTTSTSSGPSTRGRPTASTSGTSSVSSGPSTRGRPTRSNNDDKPSFAPVSTSSSSSSAGTQSASQKASTAASTAKAKETLTSGQRAGSAALDTTYGISGLKSGGLASRKKKKK